MLVRSAASIVRAYTECLESVNSEESCCLKLFGSYDIKVPCEPSTSGDALQLSSKFGVDVLCWRERWL